MRFIAESIYQNVFHNQLANILDIRILLLSRYIRHLLIYTITKNYATYPDSNNFITKFNHRIHAQLFFYSILSIYEIYQTFYTVYMCTSYKAFRHVETLFV